MAIINGKSIDTNAKKAEVLINGKTVELTLVYIAETETPDAQFEWTPIDGITAVTTKVGNRVATSLKAGKKVLFTNLTAQSVFTVIDAKFGQAPSKTDSLYKKANPARKESKQGTAQAVKVEQGEW